MISRDFAIVPEQRNVIFLDQRKCEKWREKRHISSTFRVIVLIASRIVKEESEWTKGGGERRIPFGITWSVPTVLDVAEVAARRQECARRALSLRSHRAMRFWQMLRGSHTSARFSSASRHQDSAMSLPKTPPDESTLVRYFRAGNYRGIATCLDQLKNDPKRCKEFIKRSNCLDVLVRLLRCENQRIVDRSLSILADACMNDDVREKVCSFCSSPLVFSVDISVILSCYLLNAV